MPRHTHENSRYNSQKYTHTQQNLKQEKKTDTPIIHTTNVRTQVLGTNTSCTCTPTRTVVHTYTYTSAPLYYVCLHVLYIHFIYKKENHTMHYVGYGYCMQAPLLALGQLVIHLVHGGK